jgi:2-oxoglutarate ferredoxin oxidoreductase subunit gamma
MSRTDLVGSDGVLDFPLATSLDHALILDQIAAGPTGELLKPGGLVLVDQERVPRPPQGDFALHALPLVDVAQGLGDVRVANLVGIGALVRLAGLCGDDALDAAIRSTSPTRFVELNLEAAEAGCRLTAALPSPVTLELAEGGSPA